MFSESATRTGEISEEAQKFLSNSMEASWNTVDMTRSGLESLRAENSEVASPGCMAIQKELSTTTNNTTVKNIKIQWVNPKQILGPETIFYLFGGGFICGSPEDDLSITTRLADFMGRRVCVPKYSLSPENPFPVAYNEIFEVYKNLSFSHKIIIVGESAGGNLAVGLVLRILKEKIQSPLAVGLLSPWIDLSHSGESHKIKNLDPTLSVEHFLVQAGAAYMGNKNPLDPLISPLFGEFPGNFPPTTISSGTRDLLMSDSIRLADKLRDVGVVVDLQVTEGLWHVFEWYPDLPEARKSLQHISAFLSKFI
eukprot:CAMPEP_0117034566 /NCGR_PEP_ID=MMETSP0472-20121206/24600_1 /TAXON_ID=693140 ORGANISM="Tiarina fusus, Strain LIS" /NCGR_SAMPLE_ID=MMETSP0472 /ASSEMBLY_ACC=CAM_ASM_000603 /LENGTH=309 /DNA_ID=CAMNT_0004743771 /DNA_START=21 /DNA_END=950 /DNA_ORIENTATION=-